METKDRKSVIKQIRLHVAQQLRNTVVAAFDTKNHNIVMVDTPMGVRIKGEGVNKLIPYSNIQCVEYVEEASSK